MQRRIFGKLAAGLGLSAGLLGSGALQAQEAHALFPNKTPLRMVVGYPPGGATDRVARIVADRLQAMGILNLYACIGYPQAEDEYLTRNSARFHEHLGFALVGTFHNCGYKFGRWYDMVWMEKIIGEHRPDQPPVQPYIY